MHKIFKDHTAKSLEKVEIRINKNPHKKHPPQKTPTNPTTNITLMLIKYKLFLKKINNLNT